MTVLEEHGVRITPKRSLMISALLSIVLVMVPTFGLLYWFCIPRGIGSYVAIAQAVVIGGALAVLWRQLTVDTVVDERELRGRGIFSPMVRVPLESIATVDLVPTYVGQSPDPIYQLLARDADGRRLFRLRGNYWHPGDLRKVASALPVTATVIREPMSLKEFYTAYPGAAYWFEDRPVLMALILAGVIAVCIAVAVGVMQLLQMPIMA